MDPVVCQVEGTKESYSQELKVDLRYRLRTADPVPRPRTPSRRLQTPTSSSAGPSWTSDSDLCSGGGLRTLQIVLDSGAVGGKSSSTEIVQVGLVSIPLWLHHTSELENCNSNALPRSTFRGFSAYSWHIETSIIRAVLLHINEIGPARHILRLSEEQHTRTRMSMI